MPIKMRRAAAIFASAALATTFVACGDDDSDSGSTSGGTSTEAASPTEVETGPGVTDTQIRLGLLSDTSGVFAGLGVPINEGNQAFWDAKNAEGGVCGREIVLDVKDHGYDPQKAVSLYREMEGNVLALQQLLGSPMTAALLPSLQSDQMLAIIAGWPGQLVANPNVVVVGATYDIEMVNAVDYLVEEGEISSGDKVGHVYIEGEYGESALAGSKFAAEKQGLELVEQRVKATDQDLTAQVSALKREGVKAILASTSPAQTASLAGVAAAQQLAVPIAGSSPTFDPALLETPAAPALEANLVVSAGTAPYNLDAPGMAEAKAAYEKSFPNGTPKISVGAGYAESAVMFEVLKRACDAGKLTREGLQEALRSIDSLDLQGVIAGTLNYSELGQPPSRAVYISKPDADAEGGVTVIGEARTSENAEAYEVAEG